jgi:hypothetical protein
LVAVKLYKMIVKGDFKWIDNTKSKVVFVPNKNGKFLIQTNESKK